MVGVHAAFIAAGAQVITSNSYAVVPFHIGEERFAREGLQLASVAGQLARRAADASAQPVQVAGRCRRCLVRTGQTCSSRSGWRRC